MELIQLYKVQKADLQVITKLRKKIKTLKRSKLPADRKKRLNLANELEKRQEAAWFLWCDERKGYFLKQRRIVDHLRRHIKTNKLGHSGYMRALTRASGRPNAEGIVESYINRLNQHNRHGLSPDKLLTGVQFADKGPMEHESVNFAKACMKDLQNNHRIYGTIQNARKREIRSPHIIKSKTIDRLRSKRQIFRGLAEVVC